ncbi:Rho GTPase-activating protein 6 [Toxocara canis]|uniref:Rho GTPase-activating protein 6 n=1 Tax=Toxocara canis TaxID=6265 RepID=A0A0B2UQP6_TOXCA|nr:Rho GTPase-activating protein 6 [Toxocara canis]
MIGRDARLLLLIQQGNKMDARNLATVFAPSILRADHAKLHTTLTDNDAQVSVVETMIEHVDSIFMISKDTQSRILKKLRETDPDGLDRILNQISRCEQVDLGLPPSPNPFAAMPEEDFLVAGSCISCDAENRSQHSSREDRALDDVGASNRSRSWPFPLTRSPRLPRFFHSDSEHTFSDPGRTEHDDIALGEPATISSRPTGVMSIKSAADATMAAARESASDARRRLRSVVRALTTARLRVRRPPTSSQT